jgi:sugar transferase (PEP-CTERM/EpsH1 system associated)
VGSLRILYITPYVPSPIRVRSYSLIKYLSDRGHLLTVISAHDAGEEAPAMTALREHCSRLEVSSVTRRESLVNCLRALPMAMPLQAVYSWTPSMQGQIARELQNDRNGSLRYDLIHIEHLRGAKYGLGLDTDIPIVWDSVDCISHLFEQASEHSRTLFGRLMTRLELPRTRRYEAWLLGQFDRVLVTSPLDKRALEGLASARQVKANGYRPADIRVITNGVDLDYFHPLPIPREPEALIFTGKMSYHANATSVLYLAEQIMPHVWAQRPSVELWIVGKDPPPVVRKLAEDPRVTVTGYVDDLRPYLARATVSVNPIAYGAGIQNKILEAMAMSTPVVATPRACSAIEAESGTHLLLAEWPATFAGQVVHLLGDADMRRRIGAAGRSYVEQYHDWHNVAAELEDLYREAINDGRRSN